MAVRNNALGGQPVTDDQEALGLSRLAVYARASEKLVDKKWPGFDAPFKLRVLRGDEQQECYAAAYSRFKQIGLPPENLQCVVPYEEELMVQLLFRACRDADDPAKPFALDEDDLRANTTADQRGIVTRWYGDLRAQNSPDFAELSQGEYEAIKVAVKKKDRASLLGFGSFGLVTYLLTTAPQPES